MKRYIEIIFDDSYSMNSSINGEKKQAIAGLEKGKLIIKNNEAIILGIGKKFKKMMVRHLI